MVQIEPVHLPLLLTMCVHQNPAVMAVVSCLVKWEQALANTYLSRALTVHLTGVIFFLYQEAGSHFYIYWFHDTKYVYGRRYYFVVILHRANNSPFLVTENYS